jgi:hypothetical protein
MNKKAATGQPTMTPEEIAAWDALAETGRLRHVLGDPDYPRVLVRMAERQKAAI